MKSDTELIYECIFDESYKDANVLEIVISKVQRKEMAIGFLMDMALKPKEYGIEKQDLPRMIAEYIGESKTHEYMIACHKEFLKELQEKNDEEMQESLFINKALKLLIYESYFDEGHVDLALSAAPQKHLIALKSQLLEAEAYEYISKIDKHII